MIQSPLQQVIADEAKREGRREAILDLLEDRFGPEAKSLEADLKALSLDQLWDLVKFAATCGNLASFRKRLLRETEGRTTNRPPRTGRAGSDQRREGALEARREDILKVLSIRFNWDIDKHKAELTAGLERIDDDDRLQHLLEYAVRCIDLYHFYQSLLPTSKLAAKIDPEVRREIIADWARRYFAANLDLVESMLEQEKQEKVVHARWESIVKALEARFGYAAWAVRDDLGYLPEDDIDEFSHIAADCPDLASFHQAAFTRSWPKQRTYLGRGPEAMEKTRQAILKILGIRFGIKAGRLERDLDAIDSDDRLHALFDRAAQCASLGEFRERVSS
jgi:hypothetical protein